METPRHTRILRERWLVVVIAAVLGLLAAFAVGRSAPPNYAATATLFLRVEATDTNLLERSQFSLARIKSYVDLVSSPDVLQETIDDLDLGVSVDTLANRVSANNPADTVLLEVTAESSSPRQAALIANALARNLATDIEQLETGSGESGFVVTLDLRIPADTARSTTATQLTILLGLGLLGGLAVGFLLAALLVVLDPRVRTVEHVRTNSGLPVVGQLPPSLRRSRRGKPFARDLEDALRGVVVDLRLLAGGIDPPLLVLVPTADRDRSDLVRLGLARTMALSGMSVAVVALDPTDPLAPVRDGDGEPGEPEDEPDGPEPDEPDVEPGTEADEEADEAEPDPAEQLDGLDEDAPSDADEDEATDPTKEPGAFARAAAGVRSGLASAAHRVRTRLTRHPRPVPGEPFAVVAADESASSEREREVALVTLANEAAQGADTVILVAREDEDLPTLSQLDGAAVIIVVDTKVTRRTRLRSITTALEFAGVHPAGVVMTSVPARRRDDLPSTWFDGDRIARPVRRAAVRPRRSGPKPAASGGGKQASGSGKSEPAARAEQTDLTLDFGEQEAIAG